MGKIVIFFTLVALVCVNAQDNFPFGAVGLGHRGPGGLFGSPFFQNFRFPSPDEMINKTPDPNQKYQAVYMKSDGKGFNLQRNVNGEKSEINIPN